MTITTSYRVLTPHGGFEAQWDEDDEIPVVYVGDEDAIAFFKSVLDLNPISARGGALVQFAALQPDDMAFCQRPEYGITVIEPLDDLLDDDAASGDDSDTSDTEMSTIYDSASDADTFTLIGEGAQLLAALDENSDSFFADLGRLREIVLALGSGAPAVDPALPTGKETAPVIEPPAAVTLVTSPLSDEIMQKYIAIAADSIEKLRRIDVYRVLDALAADNPDGVTRAALATWIATKRPDLVPEITAVMAEEWPGDGWAAPTAAEPPATVTDPLPEGGTIVPPVEPAVSPERSADLDFLKAVAAQTIDMMADGVAERIETTLGAYPGDAEIEAAVRAAVASYTDFMTKAIGG